MAKRFAPAVRSKAKARVAIAGPSGSGKSYTAMRFALSMGGSVGVIDTESGSAELYAGDELPEGRNDFEVTHLKTFSPAEYTAAINDAAAAGIEVLLIDSLSHAWEGLDGALEQVSRKGGNSYTAWKDVTPQHRRMVDTILNYPGHVIATMRSKTEHVLEADGNGKMVPKKVGMAPIQRPGMEYEFTLFVEMDLNHIATVTKSRFSGLDGAITHKPGGSFIEPFVEWLATGKVSQAPLLRVQNVDDATLAKLLDALVLAGKSRENFNREIMRRYRVLEIHQLTQDQAAESILRLSGEIQRRLSQETPATVAAGIVAQARAEIAGDTQGEGSTLQEACEAMSIEEIVAMSNNAVDRESASMRLVQRRKEFFEVVGLADTPENKDQRNLAWNVILSKRNVKKTSELSIDQMNALSDALEKKYCLTDSVAAEPPAQSCVVKEGAGDQAPGTFPK